MMTIAGRRGVVSELSGPGQRKLADRIGVDEQISASSIRDTPGAVTRRDPVSVRGSLGGCISHRAARLRGGPAQ
jgi:hypothetical protein